MPIYEYRCSACGHELEALQKLSEAKLLTCPACHADALVKKVSAAGFQLKGSGWYVTDFRNGSKGAAAAKKDAGAGDAKADSTTGDAKGDTAKVDSSKADTSKADTGSSAPGATPAAAAKSEAAPATSTPATPKSTPSSSSST